MAVSSIPAVRGEPYWILDVDDLAARLGSDADGLPSAVARERLRVHGPAVPRSHGDVSAWRLLGRQFASPIEVVLVVATVLSGVLGDWTDAIIILCILVLSGLLGFVQERRAGRAMRALLASVDVLVTVVRDGRPARVPVVDVVPGDVVELGPGDLVPGDCRLLESTGLTVDESALTGETFPVEKAPGSVDEAAPLARRTNSAFLGTHVASGTGRLLVVRTAQDTEFSAISARLGAKPSATGFERGMTRFGLLLTRYMLLLVVVIFVVNLLLHRPLLDSGLFSLALAVGLTPQLLPAIVSIGLAQGARAMAARRVIVRRLDAIEDFGSMSVLCSDKTGTMTAGEIDLDAALDLDGAPSERVVGLASWNAGLQLGRPNPIDRAILAAAPVAAGVTAIAEVPYDFSRKRMSVLVDPPGEQRVLVTKGALEPVLDVCTAARTADGIVPIEDALGAVRDRFAALSAAGFRVLGVATRSMPGAVTASGVDESGLTLEGLITFEDPAKPDAAGTIADLESRGISVRMVTGDNRLVATHVAERVGLDATTVWTGVDVDARADRELAADVLRVRVFSELDPVQKERVVRAFRHAGETVGYLGDGINDAPPLHAADVGITVDTAVPVAKESAAIVLLDKDLRVLLEGVEQGRRTFANTMKYLFMTTSANFGNMLSMAVAAAVLPFLPLLAGQILLINLLTDLPATAIATDEVDEERLRRPQRWNIRLIRTYMIVFGALSSVFDLTTFAVLRWGFHAEAAEFRSAWFVGSILTEVGVLFVLRTRGPAFRSRPGRTVTIVSVVVAVVAVVLPFSPLAAVLELVAIPLPLLGLVILIAAAYLVATELMKRVFWRRRTGVGHPRDRSAASRGS